jgi:group I intron endonuclease
MLVYCITNRITGRRYIGLTTGSIKERWQSHMQRVRKGVKTALYDAIRAYGAENFEILEMASLLANGDVAALKMLEREIISQEGTFGAGYNMTAGGDGTPGRKLSEKEIAARKAVKWTPERRAAFSRAMAGRELSPEHRSKIGAASKGRNVGSVGHWTGKKLSNDHCQKLHLAWTPERRAAQSERMRATRA